jgi:putative transcriptional regulator
LPLPGENSRRHGVRAALCALALLPAPAGPAPADDARPLTAVLLVARAALPDENFADSVVLVLNNLGPAPVGVIVNKPTSLPVARLFPGVSRLAQGQDKVYFGGPVGLRSVWFLFRAAHRPEHAVEAFDGLYLSADRELLLQLLGRDHPMEGLRIFIGHAGWAPGQLESEVERGDWTAERADPAAIFDRKSEHPWPPQSDPKVST